MIKQVVLALSKGARLYPVLKMDQTIQSRISNPVLFIFDFGMVVSRKYK